LFISAGQRDGLRPADLVGAIAGEAGLTGDRIGRIEIRESFTVAEVEAAAADKVIRALNGTTLRGRSVRVDYDRRSTPGAVRRSRPPRPGP
jgi:ATP-dependent RNA helicase DeaD